MGGWRKGRGGCVRNIGHKHDFRQAQKTENTDPRTNYAVKYATACGHLKSVDPKRGNSGSVCAETIAELILAWASPFVFKTGLLELKAFTLIPVICPARREKPENTGNLNEFQTGPIPQLNQ